MSAESKFSKKRIPTFKGDREAESFVETADLTEYDLSGAKQATEIAALSE